MTTPTITPLPTPVPSTDDPTNFDTRADAFLGALPQFATDANTMAAALDILAAAVSANTITTQQAQTIASAAAAAAIASTSLVATSNSSHSLTASTKAFVLNETARGFALNDPICAIRRSDPNTRMYGTISAYTDAQHWSADFAADGLIGSGGPYTDWVIIHAIWAMPQASVTDLWAGTDTWKTVTPAILGLAGNYQTLTDATTIVIDTDKFWRAVVTLGGNRTLGAPTNLRAQKDGWFYTTDFIQDATGGRTLAYDTAYEFGAAGIFTLSTGAGKRDSAIWQYKVATGKLHLYSFRKAA